MRKVIIMFALAMGIITANAQENVTVETTNGSEQPTLTKEVYPQKEADGDLYHGLSRKLTFDRMIPPHGLEVTYDKTVHVIFPAEVRYVDLGSPDLIAGKADGAENVIRVKATVRDFPNETNMSVITEDGNFYTFNVKYAAEPLLLNVEMCDFIHDGSAVNRPNNAQENVTVGADNGSVEQPTTEQPTLTKEVYPQKEADGDLYHGLTRKLGFDRMVPPHGLEVTYDKTVHVIFPAEVRYVDLGSPDLIAGKADGAENIIRVKATVRNFPNETNMSVITEDGSFYTFNVKYAAEPLLLNVEMCDFIHDGSTVNRPNNAQEIYLKELGSESPMLVRLIMKSIHKQNKREVKHIGCKRFGIQYLLKGIYTHNGLLYFHTEIKNQSNVPFDVDYITWKIVDKKVAKRTAVQEQIILPLRAQNYATLVPGKKSERTVFTMAKFTIPDDKCLVVELNEKNGGRHQSFVIENEDLVRAGTINELQVR